MSIDDSLLSKLEKLIVLEQGKRAKGLEGDVHSMNEAEAMAEAIQRILLKHNLSMSRVEFEIENKKPVGPALWDPEVWGAKILNKRSAWREELAVVVAYAHLCTLLVMPKTNSLFFVGREDHRLCALYAYSMLVRFAERQSRHETRKKRRELRKSEGTAKNAYGWREAWLHGFNLSIADRYRAMEEAMVERAWEQSQMMAMAGGEGHTSIELSRRLTLARDKAQEWANQNDEVEGSAHGLDHKSAEELSIGGLHAGWLAGQRVELGTKGLHVAEDAKALSSGE